MNKSNILYLIVFLFAIIFGMTIIHEAGHFVAALAIGVPFNEISIGFFHGNPAVIISDRFRNAPLLIVMQYAGGFAAAVVLVGIYFLVWFNRYLKAPSIRSWILGCITLTFAGQEIGNGIVEGRFHAAYVYYANSPLAATNIMIVLFGGFGFLLHVLISQFLRHFGWSIDTKKGKHKLTSLPTPNSIRGVTDATGGKNR